MEGEVERFFGHVSGLNHNLAPNVAKAAQGVRLYFLALTYPDVVPALVDIPELTTGVGAIELRVDLLRETGSTNLILSHTHVSQRLSTLRRVTSLPIVLTVRTIAQGGAFPDDAKKEAADLLKLALRVGCEYIDVETTLPPHFIKEIVHLKGASEIIASFHNWTGAITWDAPTMSATYGVASQYSDIVKLISKATSLVSNLALQAFVTKPLIARRVCQCPLGCMMSAPASAGVRDVCDSDRTLFHGS